MYSSKRDLGHCNSGYQESQARKKKFRQDLLMGIEESMPKINRSMVGINRDVSS
jgi:hypothetical protein